MATPTSIDDLLKLIRKSGMIDEPRLDGYLERLKMTGGIPSDVKKMAGGLVRDGILTYFQAEQFMLGKWRGFTIGKYKLLERIGFGGMGQVFLCEHMYMRRRVAIKVLPPAKAEEPAALGRFYREARAAAALDHPNIVRTHDIDQDGNLHFLVMEYVDGTSMLDVIKKTGPMDIERASNYVWQAVQALDHAFRVGVIHRDIKPGNILIDRYGIAKILDMGLARFYHTDDDMLTLKYDEKSVLGTADYVAPEQTINSHDVDVRADIYSLGATFYFLLAGHPPFPDGTIAQKLISHQTRNPTPIRQIRPEVPQGIADILEKMMGKSLEERYQTPAEVYEAFIPFIPATLPPPPEEEMPQLSPAARETLAGSGSGSSSGSPSGTFRQDSAIYRANILMQQSGRMRNPQGPPSSAPSAPDSSHGSGHGVKTGSSSTIRSPFADRPPVTAPNPGGSSRVTPTVPAPPSSPQETGTPRSSNTDRNKPVADTRGQTRGTPRQPTAPQPRPQQPQRPQQQKQQQQRHEQHPDQDRQPAPKGLFSNPLLRIVLEALLVLLLTSLIWWIYSQSK